VNILIDCIGTGRTDNARAAVGHRIAQGSVKCSAPQQLTEEMLAGLHAPTPFEPEHFSEELMLTEMLHRRFPQLPQVAWFDTTFHHDLPRVARMLAIPRRYEASGVRRCGFLGLSYSSQSGLLGISETSADMRDLIEHETQDVRAAEAVALFCYQVTKWIGAFTAALGGLDTLVFTGGIGENAPLIRERICAGLGFLGIELNLQRNAEGAALISTEAGSVNVRVIHTDEELMIAKSVIRVLNLGHGNLAS